MPNILSRAVRRVLRRRHEGNDTLGEEVPTNTNSNDKGPPVPALPPRRPRVLTPSPSRETLRLAAANATTDSSFFQKLPPEIRYKILVEAFGGQTVHMDLWFDHPEAPQVPGGQPPVPSHCGRNRIEYARRYGPFLHLDETQRKRWVWRSSVCHREFPHDFGRGILAQHNGHFLNAAEDRCRFGGANSNICSHWPGDPSTRCFIGAMGWLLSCRQAYVEGIDVLYTTNTIHMASREMLLNIDRLLLPQRLSSIRSVELVWDFSPFPWDAREIKPYGDLKSWNRFLEALPAKFTNVRQFYLAVQGQVVPGLRNGHGSMSHMPSEPKHRLTEQKIMAPLDVLVRKLGPQIEDCRIAIASGLYDVRRKHALKYGGKVEQVHLGDEVERHWRSLDENSPNRAGYWVYLGARMRVRQYICTMGEGLPEGFYPAEDEVFYMPSALF